MKNIRIFYLHLWLAVILVLLNCKGKDQFYSKAIGEIQFDSNLVEFEFTLPDDDDFPVAISGELIEGDRNIKNFSSSVNIKIEYFHENGFSENTGWVYPEVANWHNPLASFVIPNTATGETQSPVRSMNLSLRRQGSNVKTSTKIRFYSNYIR